MKNLLVAVRCPQRFCRSLPDCFGLTRLTPNSIPTSEPNWTACIKKSISRSLFVLYKPQGRMTPNKRVREQNSLNFANCSFGVEISEKLNELALRTQRTQRVLVELKSVESLARVHKKQVLTYLKLSHLKLGLLINFGGELLKGNIQRLVNELDELTL